MKKGSGTFFVYRKFAFATATNTPVGCLSNRIGYQEIPSRMTWNFCFDQGLEWHPRKKSIANEPGAFCGSEASGSLHIHDKSKIPATSTMLQAKKQRGQCIHKGRRKSEIVRDRIVLIHVIDLCISPRSAGETFLAEFLKKSSAFTQDRQCVLQHVTGQYPAHAEAAGGRARCSRGSTRPKRERYRFPAG